MHKHTSFSRWVVTVAGVALCAFLAGCGCSHTAATTGSGSAQATVVTDRNAGSESQQSDAAPAVATGKIGTGDTTISVANETGYDVVAIAIKPSSDSDYPADNTFTDVSFPNGSTVELSYTSSADGNYDVKLTTADDALIIIQGVRLGDLKDLAFCFDEGYGYYSYTDDTGETANTLQETKAAQDEEAMAPDAVLHADDDQM